MSDAVLERLQRGVVDAPEDPAPWAALARHVARTGRRPELLDDPARRRQLAAVQADTPGDRELARLLLLAHGLVPEVAPGRDRRGDFWAPTARLQLEDGVGWCASTGLPIRARRRSDQVVMGLVPGGPGVRGGFDPDVFPMRRTWTSTRYLDLHPVTAGAFDVYRRATGAAAPGQWEEQSHPTRPVLFVDAAGAEAYAAWAGARLPTEAEWEKVARGPEGRWFPWGDRPGRAEHGNFVGPDGPSVLIGTYDWEAHLEPVGSHPAGRGPYGHEDLAGGVEEWTLDGFCARLPVARPVPDPWVPPRPGEPRVVKGGSWMDQGLALAWHRGSRNPDWCAGLTGFRLCVDLGKAPREQPVPPGEPAPGELPGGDLGGDLAGVTIERASEAMDFLVLDLAGGYVMAVAAWVLRGELPDQVFEPGEGDLSALARALEGATFVEAEERDDGKVLSLRLSSGGSLTIDQRRIEQGPVPIGGGLLDRYGRVVED